MKRYLATCDDCPDFREVSADQATAARIARLHDTKVHAVELLHHDVNAFIEANVPLAHWFARRAGLAVGEAYDDVYADALLGLWDAAKRWDPSRGGFPSFAGRRIVGAITDGRRERDPLSRTQRQQGEIPNPVSLDATIGDSGQLADLVPSSVDPIADWHDELEQAERHDALMAGIDRLPPRVAYVIREHLAGRTLGSIATDLKVTESRACQMRHEAIYRLRRDLTARPSPQGVIDDLDRPPRRSQGPARRAVDAAA